MAEPAAGLSVPPALAAAAESEGRAGWLATLPGTVARLAQAWGLTVGVPFAPGGQTAWVAPVRDRTGAERVLKLAWRHPEAEHEADGLQAWAGHGAVRLYGIERAADTIALLLERCRPGTPLTAAPEPEQDEVIAGLLRQLWITPPIGHPFRSLRAMCAQWVDEFEQKVAARPDAVDPGLACDGVAMFRALLAAAGPAVLLVTDLHAGNVLAARREPWLVIDPKPHVAASDPAYDGVQHLLNCTERLQTDPGGLADRMADLLEVDPARLRRWLFARCVLESPGDPALADVALRIPID